VSDALTKREAISGGVIAAIVTASIPIIQMWAEGQRRDAGDKAAGDEIDWFAPILQRQFQYSSQLETENAVLNERLRNCEGR
jgi:hypothetical protein